MKIRIATAADADAAALVLRRSITELCALDHGNDPDLLATWLANKTAEKFREWVHAEDTLCIVAAGDDGVILGVGLMAKTGEIRLNYVSPDARFLGVSAALIGALEAAAVKLGAGRIRLNSTATARQFYLARGFRETGATGTGRLAGHPMEKILSAAES